jgi:hypothetical protein
MKRYAALAAGSDGDRRPRCVIFIAQRMHTRSSSRARVWWGGCLPSSSGLAEGGNWSRQGPGWQLWVQCLHAGAGGARLHPGCPSVYGGGVVDLGQHGGRQAQGEVQKTRRSLVKQRKSKGRDRLGDSNLYPRRRWSIR